MALKDHKCVHNKRAVRHPGNYTVRNWEFIDSWFLFWNPRCLFFASYLIKDICLPSYLVYTISQRELFVLKTRILAMSSLVGLFDGVSEFHIWLRVRVRVAASRIQGIKYASLTPEYLQGHKLIILSQYIWRAWICNKPCYFFELTFKQHDRVRSV